MLTKYELYLIAKSFREAGEKVTKDKYKNFPKGLCGVLSRSLGIWLDGNYPYDVFDYICGIRWDPDCDYYSHAWIEYQNIIIDISADQFEDCDESIIIRKKDLSNFHSTFEIDFNHTRNVKTIKIYKSDIENSIIEESNRLLKETLKIDIKADIDSHFI